MQEPLEQLEGVVEQLIERLNALQASHTNLQKEKTEADKERLALKKQCEDANDRINSIIAKIESTPTAKKG